MDDRALVELWPLRVFREVATTRSMTLAAGRLGVTQSAVSQAVRKLEAALDTTLVVKGSRPVVLTAAGTLLDAEAEPILRQADRLPSLLRAAASSRVREIRLGFVDSFASTAGPDLVRRLSDDVTRVVLWSGLSPSLGAALVNRDVDAIVSSDPLYDADGLRRIPLWKEPFILLLPRSLPRSVPGSLTNSGPRPSLAQLAATAPLIRFSARSHIGLQIERHLRRLGITAERRIEVDGSDALMAMVAAGIGWAIATPLCLLQGSAHLAGTLPMALPQPGLNRTLSLVCRDDGADAFAARLADAAVDALRATCLPRLRTLTPAFTSAILLGAGDPSEPPGAPA